MFHTVINRRLEWYLEKNNFFSRETESFRRTRSCTHNLVRLVLRIQAGFAKGISTLGCFIDIDSVYNNINLVVLLNMLDWLGVGALLCKY